jgi:hypothetical protein
MRGKRNFVRIIVICLLFTSISWNRNVEVVFAKNAEFNTGFIPLQVNEIPFLDETYVYEYDDEKTEVDTDVQITLYGSQYYESDWDKYSTNYFYNFMSADERNLWDALDEMCLSYLNDTESLSRRSNYYYTSFVPYSNMTWDEAYTLASIFRFSNPQYYFLMPAIGHSTTWSGECLAFCVYSQFANGQSRKAATEEVKTAAEEMLDLTASCATEEEKVKVLHDAIIEGVEYNYDIYEDDFDEDTAFSQSVYSALCMEETVCAGYAQTLEMLCNAVGIDCITVTSSTHQWNKVRINDSWYNVDCTWADQSSYILYSYFERSDSVYDTLGSTSDHQEEDYWEKYLPKCTLDSASTRNEPGSLPDIDNTTETPEITLTMENGQYVVSISCATENADIYYAFDDTPSQAYTKCYYYTGEFAISGKGTIQAIAVCDGYWDSAIRAEDINTEIKVEETVKVEETSKDNDTVTVDSSEATEEATTMEETIKISRLSITAPSKKLAAGKKVKLTLDVFPNNATNKTVTWKTSNKKYATVDSKGNVSLKKAGIGKTVTITATAKDGSKKKASFKIKIMKDAVKSLKLKAASKTLQAGKSMTIKTTVKTTGKSVNKKLKWISSNTKYATVNSSGKITAKKAGKGKTVTITAVSTDGSNKKAKVKIKIK